MKKMKKMMALALALLLDANVPYKSTFRTIFLSPMIVPAATANRKTNRWICALCTETPNLWIR